MLSDQQAAEAAGVQSLEAMPTRASLSAVASKSRFFTVRGPAQPPQHRAHRSSTTKKGKEKPLFSWTGTVYLARDSDGKTARGDRTELLKIESLSPSIKAAPAERGVPGLAEDVSALKTRTLTLIDSPALADAFAQGDVLLLRERVDLPGQEGCNYHHLRVAKVCGSGDSQVAYCVPVPLRHLPRPPTGKPIAIPVACRPGDHVTCKRPLELTRDDLTSAARVTIVRLWRDGRDASLIRLKWASPRDNTARDFSRAAKDLADFDGDDADGSGLGAHQQPSVAVVGQRMLPLAPMAPMAEAGLGGMSDFWEPQVLKHAAHGEYFINDKDPGPCLFPAEPQLHSSAALEQGLPVLGPPVAAGGSMDVGPKPQDAEGGDVAAVQRSPTTE
jgi:hypothetical protein